MRRIGCRTLVAQLAEQVSAAGSDSLILDCATPGPACHDLIWLGIAAFFPASGSYPVQDLMASQVPPSHTLSLIFSRHHCALSASRLPFAGTGGKPAVRPAGLSPCLRPAAAQNRRNRDALKRAPEYPLRGHQQ
jgi:hypothetical protein